MSRKGRPPSSSEGAREAVDLVLSFRRSLGWSEAHLARAAGVSQSAAHRALGTANARWTPALIALVSYAKNYPGGDQPPAGLPEASLAALARLWDGSKEDGDRIARLLTLVEEFRNPSGEVGSVH